MLFINSFRIVPVTIFAAALLVTVKISVLFNGNVIDHGPLQLSSADAQEAEKETASDGKKEDAGSSKSDLAGEKKGEGKEVDNTGEGGADKVGEEVDDGFVASDEEQNEQSADPTFFSQSEIEVLQQLSKRREKLEQLQEEIDTREGLMSAAEKRIDRKIADLRQLEKTIKGLIKTHDEQQEAKIGSLVKIYEAMKPKDAARIFEQLQFDTILLVAERMKERKLAPVLAKMNANKAQEITVQLSKLRDLPPVGSAVEVR
ncbi:MAG: hypothetical protein CMM45_10640 [Rhodospirillaceae bacterium]|nr:hypothetical protein [Rhodospirillaceae bacterium]